MRNRYKLSFLSLFLLVISALALIPRRTNAQGIAPEGREFYIGYMPPAQILQPTKYYVLVGSFVQQSVTITYFNQDGTERVGRSELIKPLEVKKIELDRLAMRPDKPGEQPEFRAAVVRSKYPICVQAYNEGTLSGGMLLSIPTNALGRQYIVSAWNDNPTIPAGLQTGWGGQNLKDSSCSEFMIIGAHDNTSVTIITNSTTFNNQIGVNSGYSATGTPHPKRITLNHGQVYWVRSNPGDASFDLSGSTIQADKPVAVIAGHEKALAGDPSGIWRFMDNDFRDMMLEQMIPVESWATGGYVSIPFEPPLTKSTRMLKNGEGDLYRMYTPKLSGNANFYQGGRTDPYTYQLSEYQSPVAQRENVIEDAVDIYERDGQKMNVVMYDYFQGIHDQDPGEGAGEKGDKPTESTNYTTPNEMNIIPIRNWRKSALFMVPSDSRYRGGQFINVITHRDSLSKILVRIGTNEKPLSALPSRRKFNIPHYPDLIGIRYQVAPNVYYIHGNTPFACYSYGRTEGFYKDDFGYAAPVSGAFGSFEEEIPPQIEITPGCSWWDVKITDSRPGDKGLADVMLLNDPTGTFWQPAKVSNNVRMTPENPKFLPGDSVVNVQISVLKPQEDAYAALYVVDASGNDTVYEFTYRAPDFKITPDSVNFGALPIGTEQCSTIVFKNSAKPGGEPVNITDIKLLFGNQDIRISNVSATLPKLLQAGESIEVTVCYKATDQLVLHLDSLLLKKDCALFSVPIMGSGAAPSIYAGDIDFGILTVGSSKDMTLNVENRGTAPFTLTKDWILYDKTEFIYNDDGKLPKVLKPGEKVPMSFTYKPINIGKDSTHQDWGNDIPEPFHNKEKAWSYLIGEARAPEVVWDRKINFYDVVCAESDTERAYLTNIGTAPATVTNVFIEGDDYNEFSFIGNEHNWPLPTGGVAIDPGDSAWFDVMFKADLSKGYAARLATVVALVRTPDPSKFDSVKYRVSATIDYADLKSDIASVNFGAEVRDTKVRKTVRYTNDGTTDLIVRAVTVTNPAFTIISGIQVGDRIAPDGGFTDVVLEATAPEEGTLNGDIIVEGTTVCSPVVTIPMTIEGYFPTAQGTGYAAPLTFVCRDNSGKVQFKNGKVPLRLDRVEILDVTGATNSDQFMFTDGSRVLVVNKLIDAGAVENFDVIYKPTSTTSGMGAAAAVRYYWSHPTSGMTGIVEAPLAGTATVLDNILSVAKDDNDATQIYSAKTMDQFSVDVRMLKDIIPMGDIKKVKFGVAFRQDLFRYLSFDAASGLSSNPSSVTPDNGLMDTVWLEVDGNMTDQDLLGTLQFQLVVARDLQSDFEIVNPTMYSSDGREACYMTVTKIPGAFIPADYCGDPTLRNYLNDKLPTQVIDMTPNPAKDQINLTYDVNVKDLGVTVELYDVLGNKAMTVMQDKTHAIGRHVEQIDARALPTGNYVVRITSGGKTTSRQVLIQH